MPFASFRNVQKRYARLHKERSQPEHRKKLGILPKHQDFRRRARDKEQKDAKIKELKNRALDKNDDEFYFNMHNSRFDAEKGHIPLNAEKEYSESTLKLSFFQSNAQIQHELQKELSKIHQLEARANLIQSDPRLGNIRKKPKRIIFAETPADMNRLPTSLANDPNSSVLCLADSNPVRQDIETERFNLYQELSDRLERAKTLKLLLEKREAKANLMKNSNKKYRVVRKGGKNKAPVYQFERVRSR